MGVKRMQSRTGKYAGGKEAFNIWHNLLEVALDSFKKTSL